MLSDRNESILRIELADAIYSQFASAQDAWTWLFVGEVEQSTKPSGKRLSVQFLIEVLGAAKADVLVGRLREKYPNIADTLLQQGTPLADASDLIAALKLEAEDAAAIDAQTTQAIETRLPPHSIERLNGKAMAILTKGVPPRPRREDLQKKFAIDKGWLTKDATPMDVAKILLSKIQEGAITSAEIDVATTPDQEFPNVVELEDFSNVWKAVRP